MKSSAAGGGGSPPCTPTHRIAFAVPSSPPSPGAHSSADGHNLRNIVFASVLIAIGALVLHYASDFAPAVSTVTRGTAVALMVLCLAYVGVALLHPDVPRTNAPMPRLRRGLLLAVVAAWALMLAPMGFMAATVLAYAALVFIAQYDRWTPGRTVCHIGMGMAVVGGLYALFGYAIQGHLPSLPW